MAGLLPQDDVKLVLEMLREGRSLGIRVVQIVQRAKWDGYVGGVDAREQLMGSAGCTVALKPGGQSGKVMTLSATSEEIDFTALPEGGCAILRGGEVRASKARMMHATAEQVTAVLDALTGPVRSLTGEDAKTAGTTYAERTTGAAWHAEILANRARLDGAGTTSTSRSTA